MVEKTSFVWPTRDLIQTIAFFGFQWIAATFDCGRLAALWPQRWTSSAVLSPGVGDLIRQACLPTSALDIIDRAMMSFHANQRGNSKEEIRLRFHLLIAALRQSSFRNASCRRKARDLWFSNVFEGRFGHKGRCARILSCRSQFSLVIQRPMQQTHRLG